MDAPFNRDTAVVGRRSVEKKLASGELSCVYLATDADALFTYQMLQLCQAHDVPCMRQYTRQQMGDFARLEVPAAVIGCKK